MEGYQILEYKLQPLRRYLQKNSISERDLDHIKLILQDVDFLSSLVYKQRIDSFQRVTINSSIKGVPDRIELVKHLKNPPKEYVKKYGRANLIGQSILYATFDYLTSLSEMRPNIGERITISHWKLKSDYDLLVTPIFTNTSKDGVVHNELSLRASVLSDKMLKQYDENVRKHIQISLQFVADAFSKEVQDDNHFDYYLSSHYANRLFYEFENGELDGILYPSVRQSLTLSNIALKPEVFEKYYELEKVEESIINSRPTFGFRGWTLESTGYSTKFKDGEIIWENASR
jgi:hypothetical protein